MKFSRSLIVSAIFVLIAVGVGIWVYPRLPAQVPTHWNVHGQADRWTPRFWSASLPALLLAGLGLLTAWLPRFSPHRFGVASFAGAYSIVMLVLQGVVLVVDLAILLGSAGYPLPKMAIGLVAFGVLFMVMGNYMGKFRRNFFLGIQTPWTLASDAVWERTHRFGGWLFVVAGSLVVLATLMGASYLISVGLLLAACVVPSVYSLWLYYASRPGR